MNDDNYHRALCGVKLIRNSDLIQPMQSDEDDEFINNKDYLINQNKSKYWYAEFNTSKKKLSNQAGSKKSGGINLDPKN